MGARVVLGTLIVGGLLGSIIEIFPLLIPAGKIFHLLWYGLSYILGNLLCQELADWCKTKKRL